MAELVADYIDTGATERHRVLSEQQAAAVAAALPRYQEVASRYGVRLGQGVS